MYYAKEKINVSGDYEKEYYSQYDDTTETGTEAEDLPNGGTVLNRLSTMVSYSLDSTWIAAARQGGKAETRFQLEKEVAGGWETVTFDVNHIATYPEPEENETDEAFQARIKQFQKENPFYFDTDGKTLIIDIFNDAAMSVSANFPEVRKYDDDGKAYKYRIVQTYIERTDRIESLKSNQTDVIYLDNLTDGDSLNQKFIRIGDTYALSATKNGTHYTFKYQIKGETNVKITKIWSDLANKNHTHEKDSITLLLQRYDFATNQFVTYNVKNLFSNFTRGRKGDII